MIPCVRRASVAIFAMLACATACLAEEGAYGPGKGGIGGQIGGSSLRFDRMLGKGWFGDYSAGAESRFSFAAQFRYVVNSWLRWQVSPGLTWAGYGGTEPAPFPDRRFPDDSDKGDYLTLFLPISAQVQFLIQRGAWLYYVGAGPGLYRVWVQNHREVLKDPETLRLHRGLYPGASGQFGVERFFRSVSSTSIELAIAGHLAMAQRDEQFVSGLNSNVMAIEVRLGANYYFSLGGGNEESAERFSSTAHP